MNYKKRTESDTLGSIKIDNKRLWGAQTQRSLENFQIGNDKIPVICTPENSPPIGL